jgi:hypothetical protein
MTKTKTFLKNLVLPVTPLTVITAISLVATIWASIVFTGNHSAALYAAVTSQITVFLILLYVIDRLIIRRLAYYKILLGEVLAVIFFFLFYSFQDSTININFHTDKDFILVIFDSKENPVSDFRRSGFWGRELNVYNQNIVHVDSLLSTRKDLRINQPEQWRGFSQNGGRFEINGHSVKYVFSSNNKPGTYSYKNPGAYIDSLLKQVEKE